MNNSSISSVVCTKKRRIDDNNVINLKDLVVSNISSLYLSPKLSDVTIIVEGESIFCHKAVLASQSDFFDAMFETQMIESKQRDIELKQTNAYMFRLLLKLAYFGELDLDTLTAEVVVKLFGLIERYQFNRFEAPFLSKINAMISKNNIWQMFNCSHINNLTSCLNACVDYIDKHCLDQSLFSSDYFIQISYDSLRFLLNRDSMSIPEINLFNAASKWLEKNEVSVSDKRDMIKCMRLTLISYEDLMNHVSESGLVPKQQFWEILRLKASIEKWDERNRAFLVQNTNLCTEKFKFEVLKGKVGINGCDDKNSKKYDSQIMVKLGFPFNINQIELTLSDLKGDRYSYKIDYSADGLKWKALYDYTAYTCANSQILYFESIVAQYFRVNGTHQMRMDLSTKTEFHSIEQFNCYFYKRKFKVERIDGLLSSPFYVHRIQDRIYHDSNAVLDPNDRYYSRSLHSNKPIVVALDQPIMIDSLSFQLWDKDQRAYSYIVEVYDQKDWIKVADKSLEKCKSWQVINFTRRPVNILRVKGTAIHYAECAEFRIIKFRFPNV